MDDPKASSSPNYVSHRAEDASSSDHAPVLLFPPDPPDPPLRLVRSGFKFALKTTSIKRERKNRDNHNGRDQLPESEGVPDELVEVHLNKLASGTTTAGNTHVIRMFDYCVGTHDIKLVLELGGESLNAWLFPG